MIGTRRFTATFKDLDVAVKLNYHVMKRGKLVTNLLVLGTDVISGFRYREASAYGPQVGLRRLPMVIFEDLRCTVVPSLGGDGDTVCWPFFEIVTDVLSRDTINLLDWMVHQMLGCKQNVNAPLIL